MELCLCPVWESIRYTLNHTVWQDRQKSTLNVTVSLRKSTCVDAMSEYDVFRGGCFILAHHVVTVVYILYTFDFAWNRSENMFVLFLFIIYFVTEKDYIRETFQFDYVTSLYSYMMLRTGDDNYWDRGLLQCRASGVETNRRTHTHTDRQMHSGRLRLMMDEISRRLCVYTEIWCIHHSQPVIATDGPPTSLARSLNLNLSNAC